MNINLLYVDDEPALLEIGRLYLERDPEIIITTADSADEALQLIRAKTYDAIVSDYQMPGMNGIELLKTLRRSGNPIPFIIFTGKGREEVVIEALNEGADFYLQKGGDPKSQFAELSHKIKQAVKLRWDDMAIAQNEERFRAIVQNTSDLIRIIDPEGKITFDTGATERILGYPPGYTIGKSPSEFIHPDDIKNVSEELQTVYQRKNTGTPTEFRIRKADGSYIWAESTAINLIGVSGVDGIVTTTRFIDERKRADAKIRYYQRHESDIINFLPDATFAIDLKGRVIIWNRAMEEMTGILTEDILGKGDHEYAIPFYRERRPILVDLVLRIDTATEDKYPYIDRQGNRLSSEITIPHFHDGAGATLWFTASPLYDSNGEVNGAIESIREITEWKRAECELKQNHDELSAAFEQLAAIEEELRQQLDDLVTTEEALRESNEYLEKLFNQANSPIIVWNSELTITRFNRAFEILTGISESEAIGEDIRMLFPKDLTESAMSLILQAMSGERRDTVEIPILSHNGEMRTLLWNIATIHSDDGRELIATIGQGQDITERKQMENARLESERRFRELADLLPQGIYETGIEGEIIYANRMAFEMFGYKKEELDTGLNILPMIHPDDRKRAMEGIRELLTGSGKPRLRGEYQALRKDGSTFPITIYSSPIIRDGTITGLRGIIIDITEQKKSQEALKREQEFTQLLLDTSPAFFVAIGDDGRILKMNTTLLEALEYDEAELIGKDYLTMVVPEEEREEVRGIFDQIMMKRESTINMNHIISRSEKRLLVEWHGRQIPPEERSAGFIVGVGIDITKRKLAEDALLQANRQLNLLSSITRHDILNKITTLQGYLTLSEDFVHDLQLQNYLHEVEKAADAIRHHIDFTRIYQDLGTNEPQWQKIEDILPRGDQLGEIILKSYQKNTFIYADPMLEKVFQNLLDNSIKHGEKVTTITVSADVSKEGLLIIWEDDGVGIAERDKERIFERGVGKNSGLGLFMVKEILAITGISIKEKGEPGRGARFEMVVPDTCYRIAEEKITGWKQY